MKVLLTTFMFAVVFLGGNADAQTGDSTIGGWGNDWLSGGTGQDAASSGRTIRIRFASTNDQGLLIFIPGFPVMFEVG